MEVCQCGGVSVWRCVSAGGGSLHFHVLQVEHESVSVEEDSVLGL